MKEHTANDAVFVSFFELKHDPPVFRSLFSNFHIIQAQLQLFFFHDGVFNFRFVLFSDVLDSAGLRAAFADLQKVGIFSKSRLLSKMTRPLK